MMKNFRMSLVILVMVSLASGVWWGNSLPGGISAVQASENSAGSFSSTGRASRASHPSSTTPYLVKDIYPGAQNGLPDSLSIAAIGSTIYFNASDPTGGEELWTSDGTADGTRQVKDIYEGNLGSDPGSLKALGSQVFFKAITADFGAELWVSDGTLDGTSQVIDINPGPNDSNPARLNVMGGVLYFVANDGVNGRELWRSDGSETGTWMVKDIYPGGNSSGPYSGEPLNLTVVNNQLFFRATDAAHGEELWVSDGSAAGTHLVRDILNPGSSSPGGLTAFNGILYFRAEDGEHGRELWRSDGTEAGTTLVKDINPGSGESGLDQFTPGSDLLFFSANDGVSGFELWKTDGSVTGTVMVKDINPGVRSALPGTLTWINGQLFVSVVDGIAGRELWRSDGSAAGTRMVKDINPGAASSTPVGFRTANLAVAFRAIDGVHGAELWLSNGFADGTLLIYDINPGSASSNPNYLYVAGEHLFFRANDGTLGQELWVLETTNTPPTDDAGGPYTGVEGDPVLLAPVLSDPDGDTVSAFWEVDLPLCSFDDPFSAAASLTCGDNGIYALTLTATDPWGEYVQDTATVTVSNAPPVVNSIRLVGVSANYGVTIEAVFSDPGYADTHIALVRWGDESESAGELDALGQTVTASHNYAAHGSYLVTVIVTDKDGASAELTQTVATQFKLNLPVLRRP